MRVRYGNLRITKTFTSGAWIELGPSTRKSAKKDGAVTKRNGNETIESFKTTKLDHT